MNLDNYLYFDIECVINDDAKERLVQLNPPPERKPADLIEVHGDSWVDNVLGWGVDPIKEYIKESHLNEDSLIALAAAENFRKKPRKGVLGCIQEELRDATSDPVLDKEHAMMVDAAEIVAIGWKDGLFGEIQATLDVHEGLKALSETRKEFCGWNIQSYDMPIVQLECIRLGFSPPKVDYRYGNGMFDIYMKTKWWSGCRRLTDVACALGCVPDDPLKGGWEVPQRLKDGDKESILAHVRADIERLWFITEKYQEIL